MNSMKTPLQWHISTRLALFGLVVFMGSGIRLEGAANTGTYQVYYDKTSNTSSTNLAAGPAVFNSPWTLANTESLKGYIQLKAGLRVPASATCSLDLFLPVGGQLNLGNASRLFLGADLSLTSSCALTIGTAANNTVTLSTTSTQATIYMGGDFTFPARRSLVLANNMSFTLDGRGHTLSFADNVTTFTVNSGANLTLSNMNVNGLQGGGVQLAGNGHVTLQNCILNIPSGQTCILGSSYVEITDNVLVRGGGILDIGLTSTMTINAKSMLTIDEGTTLKYRSASISDRSRLKFGNQATSVLYLRGGNFSAPAAALLAAPHGVKLLAGTIYLDNAVTFYNDATGDGTGAFNSNASKAITLGDGSSAANDVLVKVFAGANVVPNGYVFDQSA